MPQCDNCFRYYESTDRNAGRIGHLDSEHILEFCGQCFGTDEAKAKASSRYDRLMQERRKGER